MGLDVSNCRRSRASPAAHNHSQDERHGGGCCERNGLVLPSFSLELKCAVVQGVWDIDAELSDVLKLTDHLCGTRLCVLFLEQFEVFLGGDRNVGSGPIHSAKCGTEET